MGCWTSPKVSATKPFRHKRQAHTHAPDPRPISAPGASPQPPPRCSRCSGSAKGCWTFHRVRPDKLTGVRPVTRPSHTPWAQAPDRRPIPHSDAHLQRIREIVLDLNHKVSATPPSDFHTRAQKITCADFFGACSHLRAPMPARLTTPPHCPSLDCFGCPNLNLTPPSPWSLDRPYFPVFCADALLQALLQQLPSHRPHPTSHKTASAARMLYTFTPLPLPPQTASAALMCQPTPEISSKRSCSNDPPIDPSNPSLDCIGCPHAVHFYLPPPPSSDCVGCPVVSNDARDLLQALLQQQPSHRLRPSAIRHHPFVTACGALPIDEARKARNAPDERKELAVNEFRRGVRSVVAQVVATRGNYADSSTPPGEGGSDGESSPGGRGLEEGSEIGSILGGQSRSSNFRRSLRLSWRSSSTSQEGGSQQGSRCSTKRGIRASELAKDMGSERSSIGSIVAGQAVWSDELEVGLQPSPWEPNTGGEGGPPPLLAGTSAEASPLSAAPTLAATSQGILVLPPRPDRQQARCTGMSHSAPGAPPGAAPSLWWWPWPPPASPVWKGQASGPWGSLGRCCAGVGARG
jgi:serine/threonine protein kinase